MLEQELNTDFMVKFLQENNNNIESGDDSNQVYQLKNRFPVSLWKEAMAFFENFPHWQEYNAPSS
jgi:hypothetical protein